MHSKHPVGPPLVDERQAVEELGGGQPDELGRGDGHRWLQLGLEVPADGGVGAVGADHQVVLRAQAQRVGHVVLETQVDAGAGRLLVEDAEQCHAGDGGHAVAAAAPLLAVDADLDLVPVDAVVGQSPQQEGIDVVDAP